ncbi:MAG: ABC transporter substrate-binding protein [Phycisphaerales bacterium]|nr:ABC transporter substrate-binding protein [Phycisphaerales bacterium]|tara:strand:+ start:2606 stop:3511 length:906 start_codon:yes stop_codon:yes gene_type:complete
MSLIAVIAVFAGVFAWRDVSGQQAASNTAPTEVVRQEHVRIATLLPFAADQLLEMGVKPVCVPGLRGRTPEAWDGIPTVQLDHSAGPNLEQLIAAQPEYIVTGAVYAQFMPQIASITKAKVILMDVDSISSVTEHMTTLGRISGRSERARELIDLLEARLAVPMEIGDSDRVDVLAIFGTPHSFYAFLPDSYLGDLVQHAGGRMGPNGLVSHKIYRGLAPLSMEMVIDYDPDLLLVLFHGPEETSRAMFEGDPLWASLSAVNDDRMHFISDDLYAMRPGMKLDEAIRQIRGYVQGVSVQSQ